MNYILKLIFFAYIVAQLAVNASAGYAEVVVLLLIAAVNIFREKFGYSILLLILESAIVCYGITLDPAFSILFGLAAYDLVSSRYYIGITPIIIAGLYLLRPQELIRFLLVISLCSLFAYVKGILQTKEELYRNSFDKQREYSYQLEQAKAMLQNAAEEAAHMAEIKERNRIARQIHDNVGHSIAGILMQLQAANKLYPKDQEKASQLLCSSIEALSDTLVKMRDTVHNIKPDEMLGIESIRQIISCFCYCPVEFRTTGDFDKLPVNIMQILQSNIKEALTNISKHSSADLAEIGIDINYRFVRLQIKDNGICSGNVKEGLGISGMRERVQNAGGTISISNDNGFLIVCVIPIEKASEVIV